MQMLGLAEEKPAEGKPAKEEKPAEKKPAKKVVKRKSAAASRVIDSTKFTPAAATLIQQAQRGETDLTSDEIAAAVTPTGANNKINKDDVEKFFKANNISTEAQQAQAQTEAPAVPAAAAETASPAEAAIIKQMRAALNANADTEADADQISAATLDPKVLSLLDQLSPSVAKESPSFGAWASAIMIKTGADPALLPYLKASYNRLSSTTSGLELTPEADVNGAVGDAIIDLLQTQLSSKKKVVSKKPTSKKEVDDAFFAKQNARRFGLDPSGIRSLNQLLSKLGVPKGLIFFNEDGTSILAAGAGEPAPIVNVTPQERAEALENTDKLARLEIMERSHALGKKRLRAKEALRANLQKSGFNKLIELEFFGDIQNEADRKAALEKLDNDIALLKQKREENAKVFEKEFPGFLSSDAAAKRIKKELSAKASKSVSSYEVEEITLEGTYKTLAAARRAGRALQKKQPNKAVGMLKTEEGTYNVYSEFLGPRKVTPQPVENAAEFVMHLNELKSRTPNVIETTLNVSQQDVIAGLNIDFTGDSLSEKEGRNNIDAYVKKLAERLRFDLKKTGILDKIPLDDGTFYERGLAGQIALEVAKITTGTGSHRGVVIKNIRFGKSSSRRTQGQLLNKNGSFNKNWRMINRGAPMYTTPADGHDTIYIDPTALIDALATGGHTIEEFIAHELDHVLTIRAIRSAVIHQINLNGEPMTDERIEKKISDLFRNIWNNHKDHALRLALEGDTDLLDAMGQADGDYSGIGQSQRMRLEDGDIVGGSKATASQKGAEWMRALMRRAIGEQQGRGKMPYSIGDIASKYSAGKVFGWMSLLTRADVGLAKDDALPFAVEEMISAARTVGHGSNVFVQRATQLGDDIKMVVNRNAEFLMEKISNYYSGSAAPKDLGGNVIKRLEDGSPGAEPSFFSAHTPYFEDKVIKEAGILHEKLSDIDNVIFMPLSQINEGQLIEEHRGVKSGKKDLFEGVSLRWFSGGKEQYGWASTSFENEWQNENGDNAWTYKVSSKDILLKEIAEENNTTVKAIQLNNPSLGEISPNTSLPAGTRILMHGRPTGVKGGFSTNALLSQAWSNAVQNNAPVKLRRDAKADNFLKKAIMRLDELRNSNASAEEIAQAEDNVGDAQIAADLAADAIANSTRSSTNDLQGRTDRIRMLSQSQMLKEIPSTRQLMLQELEENESVPNFGPPAESMNPLEDETDMKGFSQISEEKTVLMKILQEKGSLALLRSLDLNVSTRDLINLIDNLMEPHTLEGMLSRGAVKRKGARSRAGLSYLAGVIEKSHNAAVRRLRKLEKEKDELYRKMNLPETDVLTRKQYGERVLQLIKDIRKARVQHFDGTAPAEGNDLSQLTNTDKEAIAKESEEEILFQRDENGVPTGVEINDMIGVIGQMIVESDFMNAVRGEALGPVLPPVEQAREELTSDAAAEESWGDMLFNELSDETNFAWKTKSELEMVGTDPTTGKPIYDYVTHAPWESNNRRVIREAVVNEETGEVIVPALTKSTKENWDRYIEGGGKKPWQHHVMGYTDRLNYIPSSHQMRIIAAALRQWSRRSEQFGAATMPETEGTRRWVDDFWNLAEEIRDEHRVEKTVKSRSKVGKGKKVESHTMEESDAMMRSFADWILTGNPKGDRGDGPVGNPSEILHRFEEILRSIKDNPRFWSINDYANLTNALRLAAADLKGYWDTREDELNADELMRYDQLIVAAEDFQVDETGKIGGALSLQRARNQLLGVTADFFNWQRKIRELQEKHLGKLVDNDFLEKVKGLITEASRVASNKVVTTEIVEELGKVASGDVRLKLSESLEVLEWDKGANAPKYQVRTADLYAALEERFSDELTPADLRKLTDALKTKWAKARKAEFGKLLGSAGLHDGATLTVSNLVNSADAILKARDRGAFSRQKVVKAGKKEVSVALTKLWDALAPETNLPYGQDKTSRMLSNIQDRIRKKELKGVEAAQLRYKVLKEVMSRKDLAWLSEEMARDLWYAGALSGLRTYMDIGLGGTINSFMSTVSAATDLYLTRRAENPKEDAYNVFAAYVRAWLYEGLPMFFDILKTGNMSSLPDANERLTKQMQEDFYGGENLDAMERKLKMEGKPWYHPKRLGTLGRFSRRFVLGLDYVSAQAGRKAMMVYGASGRLWSAKKAGDGKDLSELKKQYEQTRKFGDKQAQERAKKAARESLEDSLGGDVKITNAMVIAKAREIMEKDVSLDLIESSNELGRVFALNSDPIGIGAPIHEAAQKFGVLKYGAGLAFSRAALNMIAVATNYLPGLGWINAARTLKFTNRKLEEWGVNDTGWAKLINLRHSDNPISEERAKVIQLQATVGTIVAAAFWQMLDDDDWEVHGSMENLPINLRRQLMSQGVKPYSIRYKDGAYVSVKATPLAMLVGAFGNMQEGQRYLGNDPMTTFKQFQAINFTGFTFAMDVGPAAYAMRMMEMVKNTDDEYTRNQILGQFFQGYVGPVISPTLLREIDSVLHPKYYRPGKDQPLAAFWSQLVVVPGTGLPRRAGMRPMLNALGDPVEIKRTPWSRWVQSAEDDPVWQVIAEKSLEGVYLPGASPSAKITTRSGERRDMNPAELYEYRQRTGQYIKAELTRDLERFRNLNPQQSSDWLDSRAKRIRSILRLEIGKRAD